MIDNVWTSLFQWLPEPLGVVVDGVLVVFFIWTIVKLIAIIMDIIPFV